MSVYRLNKTYMPRMIELLPDTLHEENGKLFYLDGNGESVDVGKLRSDGGFDLFFPPWVVIKQDGVDCERNQTLFNAIVAEAKEGFRNYRTKFIKVNQLEGREIEFHWVGWNASHEFWLGLDVDGSFVKRTTGENWDENGEPFHSEKFYLKKNHPGYIGHW